MTETITLSVSHEADTPAILRFYEGNPHTFYALRPEATRAGAAAGRFILIWRESLLVAAAGLFDVLVPGDERPYVELGQARSVMSGAGLHRWLVYMRLARALAMGVPWDRLYAEVDDPNTAVQQRLQRLGLERRPAVAALTEATIMTLPPDKRPEALGYGFEFFWPGEAAKMAMTDALASVSQGAALAEGPAGRYQIDCTPGTLRELGVSPTCHHDSSGERGGHE